MKDARLSHVIFCAFVAIMFAAAAWQAQGFEGTARYFPLFATTLGLIVAVIAGFLGTVSILRRNAAAREALAGTPAIDAPAAPEASADTGRAIGWKTLLGTPDSERDAVLGGFAWLGIWVLFVVFAMAVGYLIASAIWLGVWFRVVHKWRVRVVIPVVVVVVAALWAAQTYANVYLPGGNGLLLSLFS